MSSARKSSAANASRRTGDNPFRYGYRYVDQSGKCGHHRFLKVPLTEEDILHPRLEDHVTQNEPHTEDCHYLKTACQIRLLERPDTVVLCDHLFIWDIADMGDHGPDIAVIFGARPGERSSFDVAREGVRPELIIEITSPATRNNDLNIKPAQYWQCGVPFYVIVDELPRRRQRQLRILGFRRGPRTYRRMPLNAQGRLWLESLQMWLGQEHGRVVCYDAQGQPIRTFVQIEQHRMQAQHARLQAEQRAKQEAQARQLAEQRAEQAEAQSARLQEELRRLRGGK